MTRSPRRRAAELAVSHSLVLSAGPDAGPSVELGMVAVDDSLIVRSFRGPTSAWFRAALAHGSGTIAVDGVTTPVTFVHHEGDSSAIEAAYTAKYGAASGLVATYAARTATLRIIPA